jgi:L-asparaginase / beta-aspartyl-peptidase
LQAASAVLTREADDEPSGSCPPGEPVAPRHLEAVVAAVKVLEANPLFNAGKGSVLTESGRVETEACVMDGAAMRTGAVAGLETVVHPIELALLVRLHARYQFLGFQSAEAFADRFAGRLARKPNAYFITEHRRVDLGRRLAGGLHNPIELTGGGGPGETVGAVVCCGGRLACATSTGGVSGKMDGRIGDTPVVGAGSYADARVALSGTGIGEEFLRWNAAGRVAAMVEYGGGVELGDAMAGVVRDCFPDGTGGFIGVDAGGVVQYACNSPYMARGHVDSSGAVPFSALWWP